MGFFMSDETLYEGERIQVPRGKICGVNTNEHSAIIINNLGQGLVKRKGKNFEYGQIEKLVKDLLGQNFRFVPEIIDDVWGHLDQRHFLRPVEKNEKGLPKLIEGYVYFRSLGGGYVLKQDDFNLLNDISRYGIFVGLSKGSLSRSDYFLMRHWERSKIRGVKDEDYDVVRRRYTSYASWFEVVKEE